MWVMWTMAVGGLIWTPKLGQPDHKYTCFIITVFRSVIFVLFTAWSLLFVDSFIKSIFFGQLNYGAIDFYLAPMILALITAIIFIWGSVFTAPTKKSLLTFIFISGVTIYFLWISGNENWGEKDGLTTPLIYALVFHFGIGLISIIYRLLIKQDIFKDEPLWDQSNLFKTRINPRVILLMWTLVTIETVGFFEGYSFFALSGPIALGQYLMDGLMILIIFIWIYVEKKSHKK